MRNMKVLKFGAVWCSGCLVMRPRWQEIEKEHPWLTTEYIDVDERPELDTQYRLTDYPAFIFLDKNGVEFHRMYGEIEKNELVEFIEKNKNR